MSSTVALKRSRVALVAVFLAVLLALLAASCDQAQNDWSSRSIPDRLALRSALRDPEAAMLRQVYAARDFRPIWMGGEIRTSGARQLVWLLQTSEGDGLTPAKYAPQVLEERLDKAWRSSFRERARTELLLTAAYIDYIHDLHTPAVENDLAYTDPDLQPRLRDRAEIARQLASSAWPQGAIKEATQMNGLYVELRDAIAHLRSMGPNPDEPRLLRNLDRLRALPGKPGARFVLVDVAANRLWLYQDGKPVDSMKVVVGAPNEQTPQMAGLIRYAIYNPFWNVPPDMTRDTYAPRIAANLSALDGLRMDAWSGFTADARILSPRSVDWGSVARGQTVGWLRQRPGPANSMGAVKFMFPNEMGIYLHDTPNRELFDMDPRFYSAGCIRVEDYRRLSRWLYGGAEVAAQGPAAEQRFDLPEPVPVYIVYLTAGVDGGKVKVLPDVYGRDRAQPRAPAPTPQSAAVPVSIPSAAAVKRPAASPAVAVERSPGAATAPTLLRPALSPRSDPPASAPMAAVPPPPPARPPVAAVAPAAVAAAPRPAAAVGACRIQAGVFGQRANAEKLVRAMQPLGNARMTEVQLNGAVGYSVSLANLPSRKDAEAALSRLNSLGATGARITGCGAAG